MQVSHMLSFFKWTPRNIFVLCFLCCIVVANAAEVDSRFDSGSRSLALKWQGLKGSLPHNKIPSEADQIKDTGKWAMPYAKSMAPIIGPGFVIALLTLLAGVIYGIFKIIRLCVRKICCNSEESDEESASDSSEDDSNGNFMHIWCPTIVYCVCFVFLLTGMIFGILNNPRFSEGVNDMGTSVVAVGTDAVGLGNGLLDGVDNIVAQIPNTIKGIDDQFTGVNPLADDVTDISQDVNGTSTQMNNITNEIASINAGNTHALDSLNAELASINIQSKTVASQMADLTNQLAVDLRNTLNNTLGSLDEKVGEIDDTVADLKDTAKGIIDQAKDLVDKVIKYVDDGKSYDRTRAKAVKALFIVVILVAFAIILGYILKFKFIFNIIAALFFVFLFFLWFFGALHFVLGMALYDSCPVMDVAVQGLLPKDSQPANVLTGCLYEHRTVLQSMNVSAYNLSDVFDYKSDFQNFANFSKNFNFSSIDSYFASIKNLTNYNLTAVADNLTVASYGWNETKIYDALDVLNQATTPDYFDLSNYTTADPTNYAAPNNQTVYDTKLSITNMVEVNRTVYNETAVAKQQLYQAQQDINNLVDSVNVIQGRFDGVQTEMRTLETKNITNCIAVIDLLQSNITAFFQSGNCSFLGDTYVNIRESLCNTMQPAIDLLTVATFLAGIALIPMVIIAEVLSFRIPKARSIYPTCNNDDNSDTEMQEPHEKKLARQGSIKKDGKEYTATLTDSPKPRSRRFEGFTASTTAAPPSGSHAMDGSYSSSPDFNFGRNNRVEPLPNTPSIPHGHFVLPPIKKKE